MGRKTDDYLAHFGVKGMKWGVTRKSKSSGSSSSGDGKEEASSDSAKASASKSRVKKSGTKALNNDELQGLVTRMNLEQQYNKLSTSNTSPGKKFIQDQGKQMAAQYIKKGIESGAKAAIKYAIEKNR